MVSAVAGTGRRAAGVGVATQRVPRFSPSASSMTSRAARRTSSERPSAISLRPVISAFRLSRVRSEVGILSIGVLPSLRPVLTLNLVDSPIRRGCTPNPFSSKSRTSPARHPP